MGSSKTQIYRGESWQIGWGYGNLTIWVVLICCSFRSTLSILGSWETSSDISKDRTLSILPPTLAQETCLVFVPRMRTQPIKYGQKMCWIRLSDSVFWSPPLWTWIRTSTDSTLGAPKPAGDWNSTTELYSPYPNCWITKNQRKRRWRCWCLEVRKRNDSMSSGVGIPYPGEGMRLAWDYPSLPLCHPHAKGVWV